VQVEQAEKELFETVYQVGSVDEDVKEESKEEDDNEQDVLSPTNKNKFNSQIEVKVNKLDDSSVQSPMSGLFVSIAHHVSVSKVRPACTKHCQGRSLGLCRPPRSAVGLCHVLSHTGQTGNNRTPIEFRALCDIAEPPVAATTIVVVVVIIISARIRKTTKAVTQQQRLTTRTAT
jgi:hypothetical protein